MCIRDSYPLEVVSSDTPLRSRCTGSGIGIYTSSSSGFGVYSDASENFMGGLTGFGQTNPTHRITVNGAIGIQESGTTEFHINHVNGGLNFVETGVADYRLFLQNGGDVGIGTSNPQERLHVNGNARIDGTLMADGFEDNTINRYDIIDEVGIASATAHNFNYLTTSWTSYLSKLIVVPTAGYILALGSAYCEVDHQIDGHSRAMIAVSDLPNDANGATTSKVYFGENVARGDYGCSLRCRRFSFVDSPGAYTFHLLGRKDHADTDYDATIAFHELDLIFIPTAYSAKKSADGADSDYASSDIITDQPAGYVIHESMSADSGEIDVLRAELAALQRTVEQLEQRLNNTEGK